MAARLLILLILVYVAVFCFLLCSRERLDSDEAIPAMAVLKLSSIAPIPDNKILNEQSLVMFSPYEGRLVTFIQALFFYLFSLNVLFLRLPYVLFSVAGLLCIYYVCSH